MKSKKQIGLFRLFNGDYIHLSSIRSIILNKEWSVNNTKYPPSITIERIGYGIIQIQFDDNAAAEKYRDELAGQVNALRLETE